MQARHGWSEVDEANLDDGIGCPSASGPGGARAGTIASLLDDHKSAEAAWLLHSRLLAAVGEAVIATDVGGTINYWNRAAERVYGWRADEVFGRHLVDVIAPEGVVNQGSEIFARLGAGESWSGEILVHRRDGSSFVAAVNDTPVLDDDGALVGVVGISYDLTERREFEQFLQRFANFGSWEIDLAKGTATWSDGLYRIMGLEPGDTEPTLESALARVHPDDREAVEDRVRHLHETLEPVELAHRIVRPDGDVRWVLDRKEAIVSSENVPLKFRGTDLDITELRRAEERLQAAELRFRVGFERSPIGMALIAPDGRFVTVNPALCQMLGRSEPDLLALTVIDVTHPDDLEPSHAAITGMVSGKVSTHQMEKRYLRPDGEIVWALVNASLVRDAGGRPDYFFSQLQDITDRHRAEEEARSRAAQQAAVAALGRSALSGMALERLMDDAVSAVATCLGLECSAVLAREGSGDFVVEAVIGCPTTVLGASVPAPELDSETQVPPPLFTAHGFQSGISVVITVQGSPYGALAAYSTAARHFCTEDVNFVQTVANVVGTAVARYRHEEDQERAHQQERLASVGQLAAGVAHDFNNIVSAIGLYSELLETGQRLDAAGRDHLGAIRQQVERGTSLVWQVLDFAHRTPISSVEVDLVPFLAGLLPVMRRAVPDEVVVSLHHDVEPYRVSADPARLQQIFMNLVTNARDALDGHGELRITLSHGDAPTASAAAPSGPAPDGWVRIDVVDNGRGMPPDVLERVFEPFYTTKAPGQGTGLGMAQVQGLLSQHGGHVEVHSSMGAGTTVRIWLRAVDGSRGAEPRERPKVWPGTGERLLVVDDDAALRAALGPILESLGYVVTLVADAEEALAYLERESSSVNAMVIDVMIPAMGGDRLADAVAERWPAIPVVLMSADPKPEPGQEPMVAGGVRLSKPFSSNELAEALQATLRRPS